MRTPDYYQNIEKTRDKVTEILDRSGLAYFVALQEKGEKKNPFFNTHGKIGDSHFSYELPIKATVHSLRLYDKKGQVKWLKFIGKKLGYEIEVKE